MNSGFQPILLWILSLLLLGPIWGARSAERRLQLDKKTARSRALTATGLSIFLAAPLSLFIAPIWSGLPLLVYYVLSVGLSFWVFREIGPEVESAAIWKWSWSSNGVVVGCSAVVWFAAFGSLYATCSTSPSATGLGPGNKLDKGTLEKLATDGRLRNNWFEVPSWAAGTWRIERLVSKTRSDDNRWTTYIDWLPETFSCGLAQDSLGHVWECEQVGKQDEYSSQYASSLNASGLRLRAAVKPTIQNYYQPWLPGSPVTMWLAMRHFSYYIHIGSASFPSYPVKQDNQEVPNMTGSECIHTARLKSCDHETLNR
jgi:hypothetical protein